MLPREHSRSEYTMNGRLIRPGKHRAPAASRRTTVTRSRDTSCTFEEQMSGPSMLPAGRSVQDYLSGKSGFGYNPLCDRPGLAGVAGIRAAADKGGFE